MSHVGAIASSPSMLTHTSTMEARVSGSGILGSSRTILSMAVETAVNGYIVIINGERYIAHKPAEITELLMKRLAAAHLEG